ncbi:OmpH family outer membrane protein [Pseudodesulfovibrio senegalensis]|uniref:OmpH family outer membrane protein n=1 Tax=Pseudodesulfovibrio senegalensis TaxID=1721087 RepID=A0A6N6N2L3_9BACT|nr:OmpH family outer membrane protein [Pseudodesulfovibrio senegalensis]KAB1441682.1 OmpH family outer membrane protein [Pseudodesulfovibrio senegalensis]
MKRILISLSSVLACLMILAACNQQGPSVGVLDEAQAFRDNPAAAAAMEFLKQKSEPLQKEAETAYKAMQENKNDDTEAAYREAMGKLQSVMGAEQQRVVGLLNAEFERVIQDYRKSKGLALIVARKSVLDADDAIDITKDIVAEMGKVKIDFAAKAEVKETPAPEKAEEKAPEAAPEKEDAKAE